MTDLPAPQKEVWASGAAYEPYVGRWSRLVAREFLNWLAVPAAGHWLDVGCGTGALSQTILDSAAPSAVKGAVIRHVIGASATGSLLAPERRWSHLGYGLGEEQRRPGRDALCPGRRRASPPHR